MCINRNHHLEIKKFMKENLFKRKVWALQNVILFKRILTVYSYNPQNPQIKCMCTQINF